MAAQSVRLGGKQFVIVPRQEYARLKQKAGQAKPRRTSKLKAKVHPAPAGLPPVEVYSDKRVAEFLLSNSVDADDYARACDEVRKMGLDPMKIAHYKPPGVG